MLLAILFSQTIYFDTLVTNINLNLECKMNVTQSHGPARVFIQIKDEDGDRMVHSEQHGTDVISAYFNLSVNSSKIGSILESLCVYRYYAGGSAQNHTFNHTTFLFKEKDYTTTRESKQPVSYTHLTLPTILRV